MSEPRPMADSVRERVAQYVTNSAFNHAVLFFYDGSRIEFQHSSRDNRWARSSGAETEADRTCLALRQFRLNAKHLQLYFTDGSNVEFKVDTSPPSSESY